jgi:hypothetical protein
VGIADKGPGHFEGPSHLSTVDAPFRARIAGTTDVVGATLSWGDDTDPEAGAWNGALDFLDDPHPRLVRGRA